MSKNETIVAELREDVGKGASRRLRREGKVPAVLYGGGQDPRALTLEHRQVLHESETESFFSSILEIEVADGRQQKVIVRDLQRHPFKQQILHVDFMRVSDTERLRMSLPLHFVGEEHAPAMHESGVVIQHLVTEVDVVAMPKDLPEFIAVDLSSMDAGDAVMLSEIVPPEGVEIPAQAADDADHVMVANAIRISESQGTGAAAEAEAEAQALEEGEVLPEDEGEVASAEDSEDTEGEDEDEKSKD